MFLPDTSCMVAAVSTWHSRHGPAADEISRRLRQGEPMMVAAPALVETYSVLTRVPPPLRLSPANALVAIESNFLGRAEIVALDIHQYADLIRRAPIAGIAGGQTYDAVIAACGALAGIDALLTFNERHFASLVATRVEIVIPGRDPN